VEDQRLAMSPWPHIDLLRRRREKTRDSKAVMGFWPWATGKLVITPRRREEGTASWGKRKDGQVGRRTLQAP